MNRLTLIQVSVAAAGLLVAGSAQAQTAADLAFTYSTSASPTVLAVAPNGQINLPPVAIASTSTATLVVANRGQVTYSLATAGTASAAFKAAPVGQLGLAPGGSGVINISFTPSARGPATDTLSLVFNQANGQSVVVTFFLNGTGQAADLLTSYLLPGGNQTAVVNGSVILFPGTAIQQPAVATFIVANRGNIEGTIRAVSVSGDAFSVTGLPLLPAAVEATRDVRFNVQFRPTAIGVARGSLRVELSDGVRVFQLEGSGIGANFTYAINLDGTNFVNVAPGAAIRLPATQVNGRRTAAVRITNTGTTEGRITAASAVGTAFRVEDLVPLPATVPPQGTFNFTLVFAPRDSGAAAGRLLVNETVFELSGDGIGPKLVFSTEVNGVSTLVPDTNLIILPNTTVGTRLAARLVVRNDGNAPASISGVSIGGATQYTLANLPALPAAVAEGQSVSFTIAFLPTAVGTVNGTLQVDDRTFTVRGSAGAPPALPAVSISNLPESAESLQQPSVGLTIAETYPADIAGRLTLGFTAESFGDDTSIQFASGSRTIDFRIPANTRDALFADNARTVQFQTGTVAGVISFTPSFRVGDADITPNPAPVRSVMVASQAPRIRSLQIGARSATSFELLITGYSSTRALNQLALTFTAAPGFNLTTTSLNVNADSAFSSWYQGAASRTFGSQFTASLTINVTGDLNSVQSVSVTGSNAKGTSNTMSVNLR